MNKTYFRDHSGRPHVVIRILIYILVGYLGLCLMVFFMQRGMLYLPSKTSLSLDLRRQGLAAWPQQADCLGFIGGADHEGARGTVLVFHGNAGSAIDRDYYVDALGDLGFRVILAEYPGYGARSGKPNQTRLANQAQQMVHLAHEQFGGPLFLWGESLGAGVVAAAAGQDSTNIDGLILLTPWYALTDLAQSIYWFLPARWLLLDRYESGKYLRTYAGPVAVLLAERDDIVPTRQGQKLYDSLATNKRRWVFEGAGHNTWPSYREAVWWREVMDFVSAPNPE